ncbi:MAG: AbrB/MazE/SpoVT family DNA-binding domain-containing protein [archaeon]|nr:MAG: AbrB/MazE/SpoVT family DNA-binding domain-containing protein [archaeon]
MPKSKVTSKFQVTIPKEVREEVGIRAGEIISIVAISGEEIRVRRSPRVSDPLSVLVGRRAHDRSVTVEELEA